MSEAKNMILAGFVIFLCLAGDMVVELIMWMMGF